MNKFEQVFSDHHQMSPVRGRGGGGKSSGLMLGEGYHVTYPRNEFDVSYSLPVNRKTPVKTLPSQNVVCER